MRVRSIILIFLIAFCPGLIAVCCIADEEAFPEYQLKAALLYNFAKFTVWPSNSFASAAAPIQIGIVGKDPFGDVLPAALEGKTIGGRKVIRVTKALDDDLSDCQILFISRSEKGRLPDILAWVSQKPVLTISEIDRFARSGGMIQLKVEQRLRFEINASAVETSGLRISSKLGALGDLVKPSPAKR